MNHTTGVQPRPEQAARAFLTRCTTARLQRTSSALPLRWAS
jgi:hypothetical protein